MTSEIRLWKISPDNSLNTLRPAKLEQELRLERWLEKDISILSNNLIIIGRQVQTKFGGVIDVLCLDQRGDVVIVELKRDKTPREITAQVIDYASWVNDLSNEDITTLADAYLREKHQSSLEDAYREKFDQELPDVLNESHSMLIVGSQIDDASERIIHYLSGNYGVNINAATFQYFSGPDNGEYLGRVFLIQPDLVEYKTQSRGGSKRRPNLTYDELQNIADDNGVGELYALIYNGLKKLLSTGTNRSSLFFIIQNQVLMSFIPGKSNINTGVYFQIYSLRLAALYKTTKEELEGLLPNNHKHWQYTSKPSTNMVGRQGYFQTTAEVDHFIEGLSQFSQKNTR